MAAELGEDKSAFYAGDGKPLPAGAELPAVGQAGGPALWKKVKAAATAAAAWKTAGARAGLSKDDVLTAVLMTLGGVVGCRYQQILNGSFSAVSKLIFTTT